MMRITGWARRASRPPGIRNRAPATLGTSRSPRKTAPTCRGSRPANIDSAYASVHAMRVMSTLLRDACNYLEATASRADGAGKKKMGDRTASLRLPCDCLRLAAERIDDRASVVAAAQHAQRKLMKVRRPYLVQVMRQNPENALTCSLNYARACEGGAGGDHFGGVEGPPGQPGEVGEAEGRGRRRRIRRVRPTGSSGCTDGCATSTGSCSCRRRTWPRFRRWRPCGGVRGRTVRG